MFFYKTNYRLMQVKSLFSNSFRIYDIMINVFNSFSDMI